MAGDEFEDTATDELGNRTVVKDESVPADNTSDINQSDEDYTVGPLPELTPEEKLQKALQVSCPITRYNGKTLGEVLQLDPKAIQWCATKFTGGDEIKEATQLICEYALQATA